MGQTILLVEDLLNLRIVLTQVLRGLGYLVLGAGGSEEALAVAEQHDGPIHLLLTDVVLPNIGGADLARAITESRPETMVLYMSGHTADAVAPHGVSETAGFLSKPFFPEQLATKIRELLGAHPY